MCCGVQLDLFSEHCEAYYYYFFFIIWMLQGYFEAVTEVNEFIESSGLKKKKKNKEEVSDS